MTSIDDLKHDVKNAQDTVLGDLSTEERVRMFMKAAAEDQDDRVEWLRDTAPKKEYTMPDFEFQSGAKEVVFISTLANYQLTRLYTSVMMHEAGRDKQMALILLNEALELLSGGHFAVDEYGHTEIPESWPDEYGHKYDGEQSKLATKYRELWDRNPLELAIDEEERSRAYFPELAAGALIGYRDDLSSDVFDDLGAEYNHSEVYLLETRLMLTVVEFYECFHTWRILAEDHLGITLDELLHVAGPRKDGFDRLTGPVEMDEEGYESVLSTMQLYIDAYEDVMSHLSDHVDEEMPEEDVDLDERAEKYAEQMAEEINCPL